MTEHFDTSCPHCRHRLRVRVEYIDQWVICKYCDRRFLAGKEPPPENELEPIRAERDRLRRLITLLRSTLADYGDDAQPIERAGSGPETERVSADSEAAASTRGNGFVGSESARFDGAKGPTSSLASIPGYQILGTLQEGAMSQVYRALQTSLDRIVAVKVLDATLARSSEFRMRFVREARLSAQLAHPNVITTIDAGELDGRPFYVMEYVDGTTVEALLTKQPILEEVTALRIALAVAEALKYFHAHGLLHRDIKPANMMLSREGGIKILDFGLARSTADHELAAVEEGKAIGTPEYISPEQVNGDVEPDIRSDIYSLGATLYRMVTGQVPHVGTTSREVMRMQADPEIPLVPPLEINPVLSRGLNALILKMLERNRDQRFRDPAELILALRRLLAEAAAQGSGSRLIANPALPG